MSPDQAGAVAALARLRGEMADDRAAMARRKSDLDEALRRLALAPTDPAAIALEAWSLHGWYTALESLLERVARQLDAEVPEGERWHRELLAQATVDVPGVRPAVLPRATRADLEELLGMRHFLRHAYGAELDGRRLAAQAERLRDVAPAVEQALDAFDAFLAGAIDAARR
jgi:ribonuclease HepT-like protein